MSDRVQTGFRIARAVASSLGVHAAVLTAILIGMQDHRRAATTAVGPDLEILLVNAPSMEIVESADLILPEWSPPEWDPLPATDDVSPVSPPRVELGYADEFLQTDPQPFLVAGLEEPDADPRVKVSINPYWLSLRGQIALALQRVSNIQSPTNILVRVLALSDRLLLLSPPADQPDPIVREVRKTLIETLQKADLPPDEVIGGLVQVSVRLESRFRSTSKQEERHEN